jgi:hypothetical protein
LFGIKVRIEHSGKMSRFFIWLIWRRISDLNCQTRNRATGSDFPLRQAAEHQAESQILLSRPNLRFIWVVLNRAFFAYCDGNRNSGVTAAPPRILALCRSDKPDESSWSRQKSIGLPRNCRPILKTRLPQLSVHCGQCHHAAPSVDLSATL